MIDQKKQDDIDYSELALNETTKAILQEMEKKSKKRIQKIIERAKRWNEQYEEFQKPIYTLPE